MSTKEDAVAAIRKDQQFWRDLAAEVGPERYAEPGPMGEWSFGDMAGHLLAWRNRTLRRLDAARRGAPVPPNPWPDGLEDDDAINEWMHAQDEGVPPEQLVADYDASYDRLVAVVEALPEDKLTDPDAFPWVDGALIDVDFTGHLHEEHVPSVRAWLDGVA